MWFSKKKEKDPILVYNPWFSFKKSDQITNHKIGNSLSSFSLKLIVIEDF